MYLLRLRSLKFLYFHMYATITHTVTQYTCIKISRTCTHILTLTHTHTPTHRTEICKEAEITKKYKNILKLAPVNPSIRTYYIAVGSRKELDVSWLSGTHVCVCVQLYYSVHDKAIADSARTVCPVCKCVYGFSFSLYTGLEASHWWGNHFSLKKVCHAYDWFQIPVCFVQ